MGWDDFIWYREEDEEDFLFDIFPPLSTAENQGHAPLGDFPTTATQNVQEESSSISNQDDNDASWFPNLQDEFPLLDSDWSDLDNGIEFPDLFKENNLFPDAGSMGIGSGHLDMPGPDPGSSSTAAGPDSISDQDPPAPSSRGQQHYAVPAYAMGALTGLGGPGLHQAPLSYTGDGAPLFSGYQTTGPDLGHLPANFNPAPVPNTGSRQSASRPRPAVGPCPTTSSVAPEGQPKR